MLSVMGEDGARGKDWLKGTGASPVSYRHNFLVFSCHELSLMSRHGEWVNIIPKCIAAYQ